MANKDNNVSWLQVNNWVPIIISILGIAGSFFALKNEVSLARKDISYIAKQQDTMIDLFKSVENRYGEVALDIKELQTIQGIN